MKKSVTFDETKNRIHIQITWKFAYSKARVNKEFSDIIHFKRRIEQMEPILKNVFDLNHRITVYNQRFQ